MNNRLLDLLDAAHEQKTLQIQHAIAECNGNREQKRAICNQLHDEEKRQYLLHYAAENNLIELATLLCQNEVDKNCLTARQYTPLHIAAEAGHEKLVDLLLAAGANYTLKTDAGKSALDLALDKNHFQTAASLELYRRIMMNEQDAKSNNISLENAITATKQKDVAALCTAAQQNDTNKLRQLISRYEANHQMLEQLVNSTNKDGFSALHLAAQNGSLACGEILIRYGNINLPTATEEGLAAIHLAAQNNQRAFIDLLHTHHADMNNLSRSGVCATHIATHTDKLETLVALTDAGADLLVPDKDGNIPLSIAVANNHGGIVQYILSKNLPTSHLNIQGKTLSQIAEGNGHKEIAKELRKIERVKIVKRDTQVLSSALINKNVNTLTEALEKFKHHPEKKRDFLNQDVKIRGYIAKPLHHLVRKPETYSAELMELMELLVQHGADIDAKSSDLTPLEVATNADNVCAILKLIQLNADLSLTHQRSGKSMLQRIFEQTLSHWRNEEILKEIINHPALNVNVMDENGNTGLSTAVVRNNINHVKLLLSHKDILIDQATKSGVTPLEFAIRYKLHQIVELLLDAGANPNIHTYAGIALFNSVIGKGDRDMIKLLLTHHDRTPKNKKIDLNLRDKNARGALPIHYAAMHGDISLIKELVTHGSDINVKTLDEACLTPLSVTIMNGHQNTTKELLTWPDVKPDATTLAHAVTRNQIDVVRTLLHKGVRPTHNILDNNVAVLPFVYAVSKQFFEIAFELQLSKVKDYLKERCGQTVADVPIQWICPLSLTVKNRPVTLRNGITYDVLGLLASLTGKQTITCPLTGYQIRYAEVKDTVMSYDLHSIIKDGLLEREVAFKKNPFAAKSPESLLSDEAIKDTVIPKLFDFYKKLPIKYYPDSCANQTLSDYREKVEAFWRAHHPLPSILVQPQPSAAAAACSSRVDKPVANANAADSPNKAAEVAKAQDSPAATAAAAAAAARNKPATSAAIPSSSVPATSPAQKRPLSPPKEAVTKTIESDKLNTNIQTTPAAAAAAAAAAQERAAAATTNKPAPTNLPMYSAAQNAQKAAEAAQAAAQAALAATPAAKTPMTLAAVSSPATTPGLFANNGPSKRPGFIDLTLDDSSSSEHAQNGVRPGQNQPTPAAAQQKNGHTNSAPDKRSKP